MLVFSPRVQPSFRGGTEMVFITYGKPFQAHFQSPRKHEAFLGKPPVTTGRELVQENQP